MTLASPLHYRQAMWSRVAPSRRGVDGRDVADARETVHRSTTR